MIKQVLTYYPDTFQTKTYTEYFNDEVVVYEEYNHGILTYAKTPLEEYGCIGDVKHGLYKMWNEDGQLLIEGSVKASRFHGEYKGWHKNGVLKIFTTYKNGHVVGRLQRWSEDGTLIDDKIIREGVDGMTYMV